MAYTSNRFLKLSLLLFVAGLYSAQGFSEPKKRKEELLIMVGGDFNFGSSALNEITGATYSKKLSPIGLELSLGAFVSRSFYAGLRYHYSIGSAEYQRGAISHTDTLRHQSTGVDFGYYFGNRRTFVLLAAGISYPLMAEISRTGVSPAFTATKKQFSYSGRLVIGIRFSSYHGFFLHGGYRKNNLGVLQSSGTSLTPSNDELDLSGIFAGIGFSISF